MANATMQALQTHAEKLNQQVAEVNASIKALGNVPDDNPALLEYRKQLRRLNSDLKDVNTTMKDYTRGVKAAGELYRHYAMGNIEDMSIKAIRAGVNGMKKRFDNLKAGGDPGDAEEMRLIEAITTEADVVVKRFKTDYQHVVEEIARGGTVTEQTLKRTRDGLADLMQTAETEAEKNELTNYWQKVGAAIEAVAVENRRLRGEVADREEAMRIAYATDHDGSQQAIHDAEARADAARRENDELRQRLDLKQQQRRELEQEMDINSMQVRALMDRRDELKAQEKEDRAIRNQRVDDANKELNAARRAAKTQQQAYDEQKQTVEKLRTEVQGLTDDIRKMGEVKAEPKIDTSELEAKLKEAQRVLGNASAYEKLAQAKLDGMRSVLTEQGTLLDSKQAELRKFTDATYDLQSRRDELNWAIEPFSRKGRSSGRYHFDIHDVEQQRVAVEKLDEAFRRLADDDYFKNASLARKYELLGTSAFGYSDAEQQFGSYERAIRSLGIAAEESGAKFRLLFQGAGVDKSFQGVEFLDGYVSRRKEIAQLNAEIKKALGDTNIDELAREVDHIAGSYNKLAGEVQEQEQEVARWGKLRQEYADNAAAAERELAAAQQQSTTAQQQSTQSSEQLAQKQEQLSQKTAELNQQQDKLNGMVDETVTANQRLARAEQEQTDARNAQAEAKKHEGEAVKNVEDELRGLTDEQLKNAQAYSHLTEEINTDTAAMQRNITAEQEATREADRLRSGSIDKMEQSLARLRESNRKLDPTIDKEEWERGERAIGQLNLRLEELKKQSAELRREPVLDMMTQRMDQLGTLSREALTETKKFWQAMYDGADKNDPKFADIEKRLKDINAEEAKRNKVQLQKDAGLVKTADLSTLSEQELQGSIRAAKQLAQAMDPADASYKQLVADIIRAEEHVEKFGLAGETSTQKQAQQLQQMVDRMASLSNLSDAALQETKKFWETQVAGTEKGKAELAEYEARLKSVTEEEKQRKERANEKTAEVIFNKDLGSFSEEEIRKGIEAAKQIIVTYESAGSDAEWLAKKIVAAEEHLKQYGVEAERQAQKQAKSIQEMRIQLDKGTSLTESALKAQHNYWQKLIDDPKTAAENLQQYQDNLAETERLQRRMVGKQGQEALDWFRGGMDADASANDIKEQAAAMKAWRDTLPKETQADVIAEIDGYLKKAGVSAKGAAEEMMELVDAMVLADKAGKDGFAATPQEIQLATKALEKQRDTIIATIREKRDMGEATKAEEDQLADLTKKLRSLKFEQDNVNMSQEKMRTLIETPANAVNLDELRAAIKRADGQLRQMQQSLGQNSDEYKRFAEQVRQAKNVMKEMEGQAKASATAWEKAFSRLKTYVVMYMGFNEVWQKVSNTARDLMDLSDKMGEVRKTTQMTADEVGRLSENLKKMDVRTSLTSLMEISASAGQLGLKTLEDVQGFTEAANKLMIALPEMGREAATEMMRVAIATGEVDKIRKQLQEGTIEGSSATAVAMEKIASTIDRLRASSASTAPEITDFVKRVGAVGAQSGITIDQVAALGSTVSSLGMRIEMSATALSRMIPAIRNNAFELAKAIGVTPDTIRNLFDTGRGMEVILMILQRIKDTGMDADSVEQMLGMAGMRDIMKDLNQQGARAGIVFSGLSQNVDELRRQLGVAGEAYEENIAIQQEFDKMNETTAAKWERLKNAFEEAFVSDKAQRFLGTVIDGLRKIVDLLMGGGGLTTALATISTLVLVLKTNIIGIMWSAIALGLTKIIDLFKNWRIALDLVILKLRALTLAQWANVFVAAASAVAMLVYSLKNAANAMSETSKAMGEIEKQLYKQMTAADKLFRSLAKVREQERVAALAAKEQAKAETEKGKAVEQSADKTDKLSKETDKLAGSEKEAAEQTAKVEEGMKRVNAEGRESARIIREINSKYGAYLGYMLSETASAKQLAEARELINKKLRETITLKQKEAALSDIEQEYGGKVRKGASSTDDLIASYFGSNDEAYARVSVAVSEAAQKYAKDQKKFQAEVQKIVMANRQFISQSARKDFLSNYGQSAGSVTDEEIVSGIAGSIGYRAESYRASVEEYQKQVETAERVFDARSNVLRKESRESAMRTLNSIMADWKDALARYQKAEGEEKEKLAVEVYKQQRSYNNLFANNTEYFTNDKRKGTIERNIENMKSYEKGLRQVADESIRAVDAAERAESKIQSTDFTNGNEGSGNSPWGTSEPGESTNWKEMTAEQLVNRRKQMNDFVNSIQTDTDVKAVLNEDKALKKAIEAGMSSDMRTVIEWYNTERLKIQDELHARHLTNTGDWLDPKKERGAKKQFRDEMDAYLHELDAYYTERKTRIEEAGTDEGLTEAEIQNRTLANEMEWQQRRAELQKIYSRKQKEVTQEELEAIYHIISERTGDTESFVKAQIAKTNQFVDAIEKSGDKGAAIVHRWMSQVELDTERSYLKGQQALTKQMKAIEDIIDRERPFNGITKQLRESLATMDILTGDMRKEYDELMKAGKDMRDFNERQGREELRRTAFMLGEAEQAYSTTIDRVMQQMREKNMGQWADWLAVRPEQQEALMAQLRQTYDSIQDAIKKEASQLKKQAEIMWNNILVPGGDGKTTLKQMLDRTVAQLGIDQGRVSRANSLIGAGASSDRVADRLAIQQMRLQLTMQEHYYNLMKKQGRAHVDMLNQQADAAERRGNAEEATRKRLDAQHAEMALNLATAKEETELAKQREEIIARTEESQNRLYTSLREWADLLTSSLQGVMEASHAGDAEYYNERAKLDLTGKGGPGAGTYVVIDDAGTSDATAHYEYLDERQALERQHEIEIQNAQAEAWRKLMDDLNMKMSEQITDWMNAYLQNKVTEDNTAELQRLQQKLQDEQQKIDASVIATDANTQAVQGLTQKLSEGITVKQDGTQPGATGGSDFAADKQTGYPSAPQEAPSNVDFSSDKQAGYPGAQTDPANTAATDANTQAVQGLTQVIAQQGGFGADKAAGYPSGDMPSVDGGSFDTTDFAASKQAGYPSGGGELSPAAQQEINESNKVTETKIANKQKEVTTSTQGDKKITSSAQSSFAKMTAAANLYGLAYQAMSNDNLSTAQKVQLFAVQAAGNAAIAMLTTDMATTEGEAAVSLPGILGKAASQLGPIAGPIAFAAMSALLGGLMGLAVSKIAKSKSTIAQATGASVGAGRLATGMLTYAEGNVNELTDPASLTPGRQYNVDGADGKTYRARYMGKGAKTHITNGPEFHLVGEAGREAIIDAKTTRLLQMNETGIWRDIQTLYNGGSISGLSTRRRRGGVRAYADGNIGEFEDMDGDAIAANGTGGGMSIEMLASLQASIDRQSDLLENALVNGIKAVNKWTGSDGIPAMYNKMQKEAQRHGEKYL